MRIGFFIQEVCNDEGVMVYNTDEVYEYIYDKLGCFEWEAVEASNWADLAQIGALYEHEYFIIEVIQKEE